MASDDRITFKEKYNSPGISWQEKAVLISLYHTAMCMKYKDWTITDTSQHFGVSIGLVSENIRIAKDIDNGRNSEKIMAAKTREDGLKLMERRRYYRSKNDNILIKINDEDEE